MSLVLTDMFTREAGDKINGDMRLLVSLWPSSGAATAVLDLVRKLEYSDSGISFGQITINDAALSAQGAGKGEHGAPQIALDLDLHGARARFDTDTPAKTFGHSMDELLANRKFQATCLLLGIDGAQTPRKSVNLRPAQPVARPVR